MPQSMQALSVLEDMAGLWILENAEKRQQSRDNFLEKLNIWGNRDIQAEETVICLKVFQSTHSTVLIYKVCPYTWALLTRPRTPCTGHQDFSSLLHATNQCPSSSSEPKDNSSKFSIIISTALSSFPASQLFARTHGHYQHSHPVS